MTSACQTFSMLLSAYVDGEGTVRERSDVETHVSSCGECRSRVADLKALSALLVAQMSARAEEADFAGFTDRVLARVTPEPPPLFVRWRIAFEEILTYHRAAVVSSLVTAAVTLAVGVPAAVHYARQEAAVASRTPPGVPATPELILRELVLDNPKLQPVVMKTGDGRTLIMLVSHEGDAEDLAPVLEVSPPSGGDL
jgi:anti-sigma factor RsiW